MGNTFEVHYWHHNKETGKREYKIVYNGGNLIVALWKMWQVKRTGINYIKLEWR